MLLSVYSSINSDEVNTMRTTVTIEDTLYQQALDQAARAGFDNGLFELSEDEAGEVLEEFYSSADDEVRQDEQVHGAVSPNPTGSTQRGGKLSLKQKLESKAGAA